MVNWSLEERAALAPSERLGIAQWIEKNRVLSKSVAAEPGPKLISRTPYLRMVLAAYEDPWVREIWIEKSAQIGITDFLVDLACHSAACDPGPMGLFLADQLTAEKVFLDRLSPGIKGIESLEPIMRSASITQKEIKLENGFNMPIGWASSIAMTASRPMRRAFCDEINKPGYLVIGQEGSTLGRIKERLETFPNSLLLCLSTPTIDTGLITKALEACEVVYDWHVPCPHCGLYQPLRFSPSIVGAVQTGGVVWEGGGSARRDQVEKTARYQCAGCGGLWTTAEKNNAVGQGMGIPRAPRPDRARKIGFHLNRLVSLFPGGRLDDLVLSWINAQKTVEDLQNFINSALAEPWVYIVDDFTEESILSTRVDIAPRVVPEEALVLTIAVDVQKHGFWFSVRAWLSDTTSYLIDYGYLVHWDQIESLIFGNGYLRTDGKYQQIWRALVDVGGGTAREGSEVSAPEETILWLQSQQRRHVMLLGYRGSPTPMPQKVSIGSPLMKTPGGKKLSGSLRIARVDTGKCKDEFHRRLEKAREQKPMGAYLHREVDSDYANQIAAEKKKLIKGEHIWCQVKADNHLLDCEVMHLAAVDISFFGGISRITKPFGLHSPASLAVENEFTQKIEEPQKKEQPTPPLNPYLKKPGGKNPYTRK